MRPLFVLLLSASAAPAAEPGPVRHAPATPKPGTAVTVSAALPPNTAKAVLKYQAVAPGQYVRRTDPAYAKEWTDLPMAADGKGTFTATVPAAVQKHRTLVRYRVSVTAADGKTATLPADELCPNFAWWCDAGPAAWVGSRHPGKVPAATYSAEFLGTLQSLHLIARGDDVARSQWDGNAHKQKQLGTVVYKGVVYDHTQFSNRGQGSAHISGKNKWGLKFNTGHDLPLVDHDGVPFPDDLGSLNLNPGASTPYLPLLRGAGGLDEVLTMRAYRLAGVPAPPATWVQWRVVTTADEVSDKDQYAGDLWGLYVAMGDMKPKLLADAKLADGITVSAQSGVKHTPKNVNDAQKQWETFLNGMRSRPKETWWRENLNIPAYSRFHALNRLLGNVDLRPDGNHGYYRRPDGRWAPIPWDNDMCFVPRHHQPGYIDAAACLDHSLIRREFRNHARDLLDLFADDAGPRGGQVGQMIAELGSALTPKGHSVDWPRLDEAVWNRHPRMNQKNSYYVNPMQGDHFGGPWTRKLDTNDFAGFQKYLVEFCTDSRAKKNYAPNDGDPRGYGWGYLAFECKDDAIPARPTVERGVGTKFTAAAFTSPANHAAAAVEWRAARVGDKGRYELNAVWTGESPAGSVEIPAAVFTEPGEYRVRDRWRDQSGRCGHWSKPVEVRGK